jgi:hypothetical protein
MKVEELITNICIEGSITAAIAELERLQNVYKDKYTNMYLALSVNFIPYDDFTYAELTLYGTREETEAEQEFRKVTEEKYKQREKERELEELERLQKKYKIVL